MKTTVDIPDEELAAAMAFTGAETKREAVVTALVDFNRRKRLEAFAERLGTCSGFLDRATLKKSRSDHKWRKTKKS